ncbi:hypothetical protein B0J18DRAFT_76775 [Chaetomium sp. MPI-SDFR-AT-0129]|nr:hypothetical protein B0J18DRAFT_76775 [Chaetomium sp. MPI-SDFR-AT-0129]
MISLDLLPVEASSSKPHQHGSDIAPAVHKSPASRGPEIRSFDLWFEPTVKRIPTTQRSREFQHGGMALHGIGEHAWGSSKCEAWRVNASPDFGAMTVGSSSPKKGRALPISGTGKIVAVDPLPSPTELSSPRAGAKKQHDPHLGKGRWGLVPGLAAMGFDKLEPQGGLEEKKIWRSVQPQKLMFQCFIIQNRKAKASHVRYRCRLFRRRAIRRRRVGVFVMFSRKPRIHRQRGKLVTVARPPRLKFGGRGAILLKSLNSDVVCPR